MSETDPAMEMDTEQDPVDEPEASYEDAEQVEQEGTAPPAEQAIEDAPVVLPEDLAVRVEAALLTSDRPMTGARIAEALGVKGASKAVEQAIDELNEVYDRTGRSFRIELVAGAWQVVTLPKYADVLDGLKRTKNEGRLSTAQLETLAIVAYKQPALRADIEAVRGAASGEVLRSLMDKHLVKIVGRAEEVGRPMLYGTTKQFLEVFGLGTLKDLPKVEELSLRG